MQAGYNCIHDNSKNSFIYKLFLLSLSTTDLEGATDSPNRNLNNYVSVTNKQGVLSGCHLCRVEPLAIDAHVHLQQFKWAI